MSIKVHGRCHCGAITYEAEVEPGTISVCHCLDCQTITGTPFRPTIRAPADKFRMLSGTPRRYIKVGTSGARRVHAFCETCGSPVYSCAEENPRSYSLRIGALSEKEKLGKPVRQVWVKRRLSWIPPLEGVQEFDTQ